MARTREQSWVTRPLATAGGTQAIGPVEGGPAPVPFADAWETHPVRKVCIYFCLATLFLRLSVLPELIAYITHVNTYLLYLTTPPAILSALLMGSVQRTFQSRAAYWWLAFFLWIVLATPFSTWRGGSTGMVLTYARVNVMFLVLIGGVAINWKEVRAIFFTIAAAAVANLAAARLFANAAGGRLELGASGSIGNSNDLAAQLLLVLPFLLFYIMGRGRSIVVRIAILGLLMYGLWIILGTASRGALVGLVIVFLCILVHASLPQRFLLAITGGVLVMVALAILPGATLNRLGSLFGSKQAEAEDSAASREYLLRTSIRFSFEHPVFGVGPDQFSTFEGKTSRAHGFHGNWHATHNSFTEVSAECGLPAFVFFTAGLGSAMLLVLRTYRMAKREGYVEIANASFCYLLAMGGYLVTLLFLSQAYSYRLPVMVGLAITLSSAAMRTMQTGRDAQAAPSLVPAPPGAFRR